MAPRFYSHIESENFFEVVLRNWLDEAAPFLEEPLRFNTELKHFARNAYH